MERAMIQADDGHSSRNPAPSAGNIDNISPGSTGKDGAISGVLGAIERNDVYYALSMIDARATALRHMLEFATKSGRVDDEVLGLLNVIAFEVAAIEDLADERMRARTIQ
jgi:hypothetical protein